MNEVDLIRVFLIGFLLGWCAGGLVWKISHRSKEKTPDSEDEQLLMTANLPKPEKPNERKLDKLRRKFKDELEKQDKGGK